MIITNWKTMIEEEMERYKDSFDNVVSCTLSDEELLVDFDSDYGAEEGESFTLWTKNRVYFSHSYDGSEFVSSVSRHPTNIPFVHKS